MSQPRLSIPHPLRQELERTTLHWEIRRARRHLQILVCGRQVLVIPYSAEAGRRRIQANALAALRRALRQASEQQQQGVVT